MTRKQIGVAAAIAGFVLALLPERVLCWMGRGHDYMRHPLGGYRCAHCGKASAELEAGYVSPLRTRFHRQHSSVERTSAWPSERPEVSGNVTPFLRGEGWRKRRGA